jgi:hypothetical protein
LRELEEVMALVRMTKVRGFIGVVFAIAVLVLFAAFVAPQMGWDIPVLNSIAKALGM